MRKQRFRVAGTIGITLFGFVLSSVLSIVPVKAESSVFFDPTNVNVASGETFTVSVKANSDSPFNTAQVDLGYSSGLELVSVAEGSALPNVADSSSGAGNISYALYNINSISGNNLQLLSASFKLTGDGANINFLSSTRLLEAGKTVANGSGTVTVTKKSNTTPAPTPAPDPPKQEQPVVEKNETQPLPSRDSSPPTQQSTSTPSQPQSQSTDKSNPVIEYIKTSGFIDDNISIKISTNEPTKAKITSGNSANNLFVESLSSGGYKKVYFVSLGKLSRSIEDNNPFFYRVQVTDQAGNATSSKVLNIQTEGVSIILSITRGDGSPLKNKNIVVNGKEFKTDNSGKVKIKNIVPGAVNVSVINDDGEEVGLGEITAVEGVQDQEIQATLPEVAGEIISDGSPITISNSLPYVYALAGLLIAYMFVRITRNRIVAKKEALAHTPNPYGKHLSIRKKNSLASTIFKPVNTKTRQQGEVDSSQTSSTNPSSSSVESKEKPVAKPNPSLASPTQSDDTKAADNTDNTLDNKDTSKNATSSISETAVSQSPNGSVNNHSDQKATKKTINPNDKLTLEQIEKKAAKNSKTIVGDALEDD